MNKRIDRLSAVIVDAILNNQERQSTIGMARAMVENGIPLQVAIRVIARPWERRGAPTSSTRASPE